MKTKYLLFLLALLLFIPLTQANLLTNGDFESVYSVNKYAGCVNSVTGTCDINYYNLNHPYNWSEETDEHLFSYIDSDASNGQYALRLFSHDADNCSAYYNVSTSSWITTESNGLNGLVYQNFTIDNFTATVSYDIKKCPDVVSKCNNFWLNTEDFGDTPIKSDYLAVLEWNYSGNTYILRLPTSAPGDNWEHKVFSLTNNNLKDFISAGTNMTLYFLTDKSELDNNFYCILLDNVSIDYTEEEPSPATTYIDDLTTLKSTPGTLLYKDIYRTTGGSWTYHNNFQIDASRGYDGVILLNTSLEILTGVSSSPTNTVTYAYIYYNDGSVIDVKNYSKAWYAYISGSGSSQVNRLGHVIPVPDLDNVKNITTKCHYDLNGYPTDVTMSYTVDNLVNVRNTYSDTLTSTTETIIGNNDLYPLIVYDNSIVNTTVQQFKIYNFGYQNTSAYLDFYQYDSANNLKETYSLNANDLANGATSFSEDWLLNPASTDYIKVYVYPNKEADGYLSNSTTIFYLSAGTGCSSYCIGLNYYEGTLGYNNICEYTISYNDTRCYATTTTTTIPSAYEPLANATLSIGNQAKTVWNTVNNNFDETTKMFLSIIIIIAIALLIGQNAGWQVSAISVLLTTLVLTVIGWLPAWIGIIFLILSGFIVVNLLRNTFLRGD